MGLSARMTDELEWGDHPLILAVVNNNLALLEELLKAGLDCTWCDNMAIDCALSLGRLDALSTMFRHNSQPIDLNECRIYYAFDEGQQFGEYPRHSENSLEVLRFMLQPPFPPEKVKPVRPDEVHDTWEIGDSPGGNDDIVPYALEFGREDIASLLRAYGWR